MRLDDDDGASPVRDVRAGARLLQRDVLLPMWCALPGRFGWRVRVGRWDEGWNMSERRFTYEEACNAMQVGVGLEQGAQDETPKHLRVGVNSALCDTSALAGLLVKKGIISADEYEEAITD